MFPSRAAFITAVRSHITKRPRRLTPEIKSLRRRLNDRLDVLSEFPDTTLHQTAAALAAAYVSIDPETGVITFPKHFDDERRLQELLTWIDAVRRNYDLPSKLSRGYNIPPSKILEVMRRSVPPTNIYPLPLPNPETEPRYRLLTLDQVREWRTFDFTMAAFTDTIDPTFRRALPVQYWYKHSSKFVPVGVPLSPRYSDPYDLILALRDLALLSPLHPDIHVPERITRLIDPVAGYRQRLIDAKEDRAELTRLNSWILTSFGLTAKHTLAKPFDWETFAQTLTIDQILEAVSYVSSSPSILLRSTVPIPPASLTFYSIPYAERKTIIRNHIHEIRGGRGKTKDAKKEVVKMPFTLGRAIAVVSIHGDERDKYLWWPFYSRRLAVLTLMKLKGVERKTRKI